MPLSVQNPAMKGVFEPTVMSRSRVVIHDKYESDRSLNYQIRERLVFGLFMHQDDKFLFPIEQTKSCWSNLHPHV